MITIAAPVFLGKEVSYVEDVLSKRTLRGGEYVKRFEALVARSAEAQHCVATSSGTTALHSSLLALGVKPGDLVVVPSCSYIATANAVRYCEAIPVFVDVRQDTWTMDPEEAAFVAGAVGAVGIITVHLYGVPCPVPDSSKWVLEDACEAHGVPLRGTAAVFSYYGNKIVSCGEGGAVVTNFGRIDERTRLYIGQGTSGRQRYIHETLGYNYRMGELQAAVGTGQMETLALHLSRREKLRAVYDELLPERGQKRPIGSVNWVMPVLVKNRDFVAQRLAEEGIETRPVFPPLHLQPVHRTAQSLPVSERLAENGLLLPLHCGMSTEDVSFVCWALLKAEKEAA